MAENIIESYSLQYQIEYDILRIAHVYGPGIQIRNDGRVMGDLLNDAINNQKIHLKSNGKSIRSFCYVTDAIEAIFRILTDGKKNEVYNIANETKPVTIFKLAQLIQETLGKSKDDVIASSESAVQGYCNYPRVKLDTSKIENLGWKPKISLAKGLKNTMQSLINQ